MTRAPLASSGVIEVHIGAPSGRRDPRCGISRLEYRRDRPLAWGGAAGDPMSLFRLYRLFALAVALEGAERALGIRGAALDERADRAVLAALHRSARHARAESHHVRHGGSRDAFRRQVAREVRQGHKCREALSDRAGGIGNAAGWR